MSKNITIIDKEYKEWIKDLSMRYRRSQIKAAVKVNTEKLLFNWQLGRDIVEMHVEDRWGEKVITQLSKDLQQALPGVEGLSRSNIYYCKSFYMLYNHETEIVQQVVGQLENKANADASEIVQQPVGLFQIPWGHHCTIIDKVKGDRQKALFFVRKTIEEGWSRAVLETWITSNLYEREGKAVTNFQSTLPEPMSDLAKEITKDNLLAQYALEGSSQPIGISEFDLEKLYPTKVEGMIPTLEELEDKLNDKLSGNKGETVSDEQ